MNQLNLFTAKVFLKIGKKISKKGYYNSANVFFQLSSLFNPQCLELLLNIADIYLAQSKYVEVAKIYKRVISLQPTFSTVYKLGLDLARNGELSNDFYQSILEVIETPEIVSMIKYLTNSREIYHPSKLWLYFMVFNTFQLEAGKIENFKRTVNHNYFNWTADSDIDSQFQSLKKDLSWSEGDLEEARQLIIVSNSVKPKEFTEEKWSKYCSFLCMLWEFTLKYDDLDLLNNIHEPLLGNPVYIKYKGNYVTQDICNSVMEINTIMKATNYSSNHNLKIMELGAGHGRIGNILLQFLTNVQVVIVDIPPALYVSQWYLTSLFPNHSAFKFRSFHSYEEIQKEFEASSVAFLSPEQVEYLPSKTFDIFINISSFHEMTTSQIETWFDHIDRLCKGYFYTKQYISSHNGFDEILICEEDYPIKSNWVEVLNRKSQIFPALFESIYKIF